MTREQLNNANKLSAKIENLEKSIEELTKSYSYSCSEISLNNKGHDWDFKIAISKFISFEELKEMALTRLNKKLDELKIEFDKI